MKKRAIPLKNRKELKKGKKGSKKKGATKNVKFKSMGSGKIKMAKGYSAMEKYLQGDNNMSGKKIW